MTSDRPASSVVPQTTLRRAPMFCQFEFLFAAANFQVTLIEIKLDCGNGIIQKQVN
jgi:hypothetical protein